jgi:peptidoglycan-associated lipoprotein
MLARPRPPGDHGRAMTRSTPLFLAAASVAALLTGCASKPKPLAGAPTSGSDATPTTELPTSRPPEPGAVGLTAQEALAAAAGADRVYFGFDSDVLEPAERDTLRRQAAWLAANPGVQARIEGHADERGTREYNLALGARRAAAARQALIEGGVAAGRITTLSFGKERPQDPGSTEAAWARNRNAHTVVIGLAER